MTTDDSTVIKRAILAYNSGNLPLADIFCQHLVDKGTNAPIVYELLGLISYSVRAYETALHYFQHAIDLNPSSHLAITNRDLVAKQLLLDRPEETSNASYLLIKAWGHGFWSDVDHVLGQLLLAEITGRIPVIHWSAAASRFSDGSGDNAFNIYFEPVSDLAINDLISPHFSYFPKKWSAANLRSEGLNKFRGADSRMAGLYYLNRTEDVLVSDFHTLVNDLRHWIPSWHGLHGEDGETIYRYLFTKYIKLNANIRSGVELFRNKYLSQTSCLAVHVRGSDKQLETNNLSAVNDSYHGEIATYLENDPELSIFLLTDHEPALTEYQSKYPGKVISTRCRRTAGPRGVHELFQDEKIGIEVVTDAYLAAGCRYFVGNGWSNVSTSILHMKSWSDDDYTLVNDNTLYQRNFFLHHR